MIPKISVLMPVYNGEEYLNDSIESVLSQTFNDFEFIMIDDGSIDKSINLISSYKDERIKLVRNKKNLGLIDTLNIGLKLSKGEYIARMDCDDVCVPERLEVQYNYMEQNKLTGVCGSWIKTFGEKEEVWEYPVSHDDIKARLLFENCIAHPTAFIRRKIFEKHQLNYRYRKENFLEAQDYDLWVRCSDLIILNNIPKVLLKYRIHPNKVGKKKGNNKLEIANNIRQEILQSLDLNFKKIHEQISLHEYLISEEYVKQCYRHLTAIWDANEKKKKYSQDSLCKLLLDKWLRVCKKNSSFGFKMLKLYREIVFFKNGYLQYYNQIKLLKKIIFNYFK